jgi:hypothetical protein
VPPDWNEDRLLAALKSVDTLLGDSNPQLSLYPACCGTTQTALLHLDFCTTYFKQLKPGNNYLPASDGVDLVIDRHFHDLTPLNSPGDEVVAELVMGKSCVLKLMLT